MAPDSPEQLARPFSDRQRPLAISGWVPERIVARLERRWGRTPVSSACNDVSMVVNPPAVFVALHPCQRQQDQQRLVGGVHTGPLCDGCCRKPPALCAAVFMSSDSPPLADQ